MKEQQAESLGLMRQFYVLIVVVGYVKVHVMDLMEKGQATHPVFLGFPAGSAGKESARNAGDLSSIPGLGRPPGEGKGYPLQYSGLENSMDCVVHGVAKSQT